MSFGVGFILRMNPSRHFIVVKLTFLVMIGGNIYIYVHKDRKKHNFLSQ